MPFDGHLARQGYNARCGQILDASIVPVPRNHISDAALHDCRAVDHLLVRGDTGAGVWADAACRSEDMEAKPRAMNLNGHIHRKGKRGKPLTEQAKGSNRTRLTVRVRVEHIFGAQANDIGGTLVCKIGMDRTKARIGDLQPPPPRPAAPPKPKPCVTHGRRSGREAGQATCQRRGADNLMTRQNEIDGPRARLKPPEAQDVSRNGQKSRCPLAYSFRGLPWGCLGSANTELPGWIFSSARGRPSCLWKSKASWRAAFHPLFRSGVRRCGGGSP